MARAAVRFGYDHLAELAGRHAGAIVGRTVEHHADAYALVDVNEDQAMRALDGEVAVMVLGKSGCAHDVVDVDRHVQAVT